MQVTELHLHTDFSLLDGLNNAEEYMVRAKELGMTHLAITDHGVLPGHRPFQVAAEAAGITPILGVEAYISPTDRFDRRPVKKRDDDTAVYNHIGLLAKNANGLKNLNHLSEIAWTEGFYSKPRIDFDLLEEYSDDIIVLSGCLSGMIPKAITNKLPRQADQLAREFKRVFGDRFFIEIQGHNEKELNLALLDIAKKHGIKPVVTSDCHYARKEDLWLEEAMLILSTSPTRATGIDLTKAKSMEMLERFNYLYPERKLTFEKFEIYLRSATEHQNLLAAQGIGTEPIENTNLVASMIGEYPYYEGLDLLPNPTNGDPDEILERMVRQGMIKRGLDGDPASEARIREELDIIKAKHFSTYILIEADAVQFARGQGIFLGPGRGSGAGSLVLYVLYVTNVNPLEHNLLFFRFINPERNDKPDVDTDVEDARRYEIKDYILRKYKNMASIATFGKFQGKSSVRDASRVFCVPLGEVNKALKGADWPLPADWWFEWERTDRGNEFCKKYPDAIRLAKFLFGRIKTQGMHAGGLVVSNQPISNFAPMQTAIDKSNPAAGRVPLVALDMEEVEAVGLIKYDWLGVKALTIISDTLKSIKERHGKDIDLDSLPLTDSAVFKSLSSGYTKGVFQAEAVPYTNLLIKMGGVKNFAELAASNALVRPGAQKSTAGKAFINRKEGVEMITYPHPDMQWFTKETYGTIIYQEQVMLTMTELAGMSMSDADKVRKIIGKKKDVSEFEIYKSRFIEGASAKIPGQVAERLWHDFEAHAGYSFNKSHAVAYSMVTYWTAWLKEYYPLEFITAALKNESDKDWRLDYLIEAKRLGIRVMLPHVNTSGIDFEIQSDENGDFVIFGLSDIKFISGKFGNRLLDRRPFSTYNELYDVITTEGSGLNVRVLQALNAVGAAAFSDNPRTGNERENFFEFLSIPAFESRDLSPVMKSQFQPLDEFSEDETFVSMGMVREIKTGPGWARVTLVDESGSAGVFTNEHTAIESGRMYVFLIANNRISRYISVADLVDDQGGDFQEFLEASRFDVPDGKLRVVSFNSRKTKAGKRMADAVFCDNEKNLQAALVFPAQFMKCYAKCVEGEFVDVRLQYTKDGAVYVDDIF